MSIGSKLILSFLLVTLLPTILLAIFTTNIISNSKKADAQETINSNLKAAWMQYYSRAHQMQFGMLQASTEFYIKKAIERKDRAFLTRQIKDWKKYRPNVDMWEIVDDKGAVIASLNAGDYGHRLPFSGIIERAMKSRSPLISTEVIPEAHLVREGLGDKALIRVLPGGKALELKDGMMLIVVTPVTDETEAYSTGAIITGDLINNDTYVPDSFAEVIPGSLVSIVLGDVQIATNVAGSSGRRIVGERVPPDVVSGISVNKGFRGDASIAGRDYIAAFDPIVNNSGAVIGSLFVGLPREKFVELQYENIKAIVTIAFIGLFIATGVAFFITFVITKPIKALKKRAQLVSKGNLSTATSFMSKAADDEIADLARTFDRMVKGLSENEKRIRASQENIGRQKSLIESIINSLPYCLYVLERNMGIVVWNRHSTAPCPICGSGPDAGLSGMNFISHLADTEMKEGLEETINRVFDAGGPVQYEKRVALKGPPVREVHLSIVIFPIPSGRGTSEYVVWMAEDISRKKGMEASVISSEKLAAIGTLAAGIAHEVNNPLGGILNCLYNLRNKNIADERKAEYLEFMEDGIKRVQNIVRQLLDFSQQHAPERTLTDINSMIEGVIPLFMHYIKDMDTRLVKNLGAGLPPILVDKHQIEQILVNLILNAIQAVNGGDGAVAGG
ncbi:MAG: cache domain-containing protein, partial [Deltaproteobacteria bacterium]|nr:cache domain-containing protein [Deltaproteobacteria bacterium]